MEDLKLRYLLQINLWNTVLSIRSGKYFVPVINNALLESIDKCNANDIDTPKFMYLGNEDVILKKILATFSLRPIISESLPIMNITTKPFTSGYHR